MIYATCTSNKYSRSKLARDVEAPVSLLHPPSDIWLLCGHTHNRLRGFSHCPRRLTPYSSWTHRFSHCNLCREIHEAKLGDSCDTNDM